MAETRGLNAEAIGRRLRELRATRGLSLRQLARDTGASPSLLSQIENGKITPSVDTLYGLARALGTPIAAFFGGDSAAPRDTRPAWVVRRAERRAIQLEHGVTWENLLPTEEAGLRFMKIRYRPGATSGDHLLRHPGRDLFLVLAGELTFRVGFSEHVLRAGDSIGFTDFQPHQLRNEGADEAVAIVCVIGDEESGADPRS